MFRSLHRLLFSVLALSAPAFANPPLVEVVQPELRLVRDELVTFGSLRSDESLMIRPEVDGRVAQLHFREGQAVSAGDLLVSLDDAITRAELAQAEANLSLAQKNYERAQRLFSRGASNAQARDEAQAEEQAASASLALARARLDKTRLHAPHDGVLGLRHVSPGDYLEAGQDIVNLEVLDPLKVEQGDKLCNGVGGGGGVGNGGGRAGAKGTGGAVDSASVAGSFAPEAVPSGGREFSIA